MWVEQFYDWKITFYVKNLLIRRAIVWHFTGWISQQSLARVTNFIAEQKKIQSQIDFINTSIEKDNAKNIHFKFLSLNIFF